MTEPVGATSAGTPSQPWRDVTIQATLRELGVIPGATIHPAHTDHAACVLGARRFVPALVQACNSVADRLPARV